MDRAQEFLTYFNGPLGYLFFYLLITACGCGFPCNSDITLIAAAVLCANGVFQLWILMILAFCAILTGDSICFFVARKWGLQLVQVRPFRWILNEKSVNKARKHFEHHGQNFLFFVRFLPLIRTPLFFAAGTLQIPVKSFYFMNGAATFIYVPILMLSSFYASENIDVVLQTLKKFQFGLLGLSVLFVVFLMIRKKKPSSGNQE